MALLRKKEGIKPLQPRTSAPSSSSVSSLRPHPVKKASPCQTRCLAGTDVRGVVAVLAQREKLGLSMGEACERAFKLIVETNPFPATTGRICPHRCEEGCTRHQKDGGVAVGSIERFIGDFALEQGLKLPGGPEKPIHREKIAIIGAGPAGLSCAYQLRRLGYASTIFEGMPQPGGMLRYGIPAYRLPARVFEGEIQRILNLGAIELRTRTMIGRDVSLDELRQQYATVFVAPGAAVSRAVDIPGAKGAGVFRAVDFLRDVARQAPPGLGRHVVVVGGGNTAIDAARVAARLLGGKGEITLLRQENETIDDDLREAMDEGVSIEFLSTLDSVVRDAMGGVDYVVIQRIELGEKDANGFPTLIPIAGKSYELRADSVILALGQKPNVNQIFQGNTEQFEMDDAGRTRTQGVYRGGDAVTPSFAAIVIGQGRQVAISIDAELRGKPLPEPVKIPDLQPNRIKLECYEARSRLERRLAPVQVRLADLESEIDLGNDATSVFQEASRCLSCGNCFGCERCWMYCTPGCMTRVPTVTPGQYFSIKTEKCDGCRKCAEECPSGFLEMS
jgi:NADPH-dependent glutamate synthase beta subunit-like oxidoreductase/Pyruvate/2-oxoacid:ferredoxin oxidoreductase delta subunit